MNYLGKVTHIISEFFSCREGLELFTDQEGLKEALIKAVRSSDLTDVCHSFYQFDGGGLTGTVVLAESHMNVHTWPERDFYLNLDISVCNYTCDNYPKAVTLSNTLKELFKPTKVNEKIIKGMTETINDRCIEYFSEDYGFFIKPRKTLFEKVGQHQTVEVLETNDFGKVLRLDDYFQTSEKDEFFYHETMVHPPMISHPCPKDVLIIGGGDGGCLEEVLKHNTVQKAVMVEIDDTVVNISKKYLGTINGGAFDDPRTRLEIIDGLKYIEKTNEKFDFVILDLTDPVGPAKQLYSKLFYQNVKSILKDDQSILALHTEYPFMYPDFFGSIIKTLGSVFEKVTSAYTFVPLYGTIMSFAYCSGSTNPRTVPQETILNRITERGITNLQLYNESMHHALCSEPEFVRHILQKDHIILENTTEFDQSSYFYNARRL